MMLMGGGIKGGQVIGASSDVGRQAQPVDLATGLVHESGELLPTTTLLEASAQHRNRGRPGRLSSRADFGDAGVT